MKYAYYPGCSLRGTGRAYEESLLAVFRALDVAIQELNDWNCCGATTYLSIDELTSYALAARNLALAARDRLDIIAPCAACYLVLNKTQRYIHDYPDIKLVVTRALDAIGLKYDDRVRVRHPLDIFLNEIGVKAIASRVTRSLKGLKVAPYYGCQIVRPYATFDDQRNPTSMDRLLEACGAEIIPYSLKTRCCGGSQKGTLPEVGLYLINYLVEEAQMNGADVIATVCPLCQFNLECFQKEASSEQNPLSTPVLYFTQLMALALGASSATIGLRRSLVKIEPVLEAKEIAYA
ncbi:MAG TPA: CoB--CoM heterodisulfide reductase iron-sulfur subunit B family protein [Terriglobales bacterium]|nr:CoB--CoM heterodisulfide reductase iron-sulfur subunit B family protein [Terriglobales bacterium]